MRESDRRFAILGGFVFVMLFGFIEVRWLSVNCRFLGNDCLYLIMFGFGVIITTIVFVETYIRRQQVQGNWYQKRQSSKNKDKNYVWTKAVIRIMFTSFLLGLPLFIQGGFGMLISGVIIGLGLDVFVRGLTGNIAPRTEPTDSE